MSPARDRCAGGFPDSSRRNTRLVPLSQSDPETTAKDVLLNRGAIKSGAIQEILIGVQNIISEKFIDITMKISASRLQNCVNVSAAVANLRSVVQGGLHLELLDHVGIG